MSEINPEHLSSDLRIIQKLGIDPLTVVADSVQVLRWPEDALHDKAGKPYAVIYSHLITEGLDVLDD